MRIVWLSFAQRDLLSISAYYESVATKELADRLMQRIVHSASSLITNPYLGRPSESVDGVHELLVPDSLISFPTASWTIASKSCASSTSRRTGHRRGKREDRSLRLLMTASPACMLSHARADRS